MKKYLLPNTGNEYKAELHIHTNLSDGVCSPQEMKQAYKERGFSIVAFTEHEIFVPHNDLTDDEFLAINAVECAVNEDYDATFSHMKTYHLNFYAKDKDIKECPITTPSSVWLEHSRQYMSEAMKNNDFAKEYSVEGINSLIKKANDGGFLACYNHPVWSLQDFTDYDGLQGLWGIEVYNTGSALGGYVDTNQPFEDFLRRGKRVFPICADDSHSTYAAGKAWAMVKANSLDYESVMGALERGDFYSSIGPKINEISLDGGELTIKTSEVVEIFVITDIRITKRKRAKANETIDEAVFSVSDFIAEAKDKSVNRRGDAWFRIEIKDKAGDRAWSRAYFVDELE